MRARLLLVAAAVLAAACADLRFTTAVSSIAVPIADPLWSEDLAPIIAETCASSGACHGGAAPANGLNLTADSSWAHLVGVPAVARSMLRVMPGQPDSSFFFRVLSTDVSYRLGYPYRMPLTEYTLPQPLVETIRNWILDGAPN